MRFFNSIFILVWLFPMSGNSQTFFDNYYNVGYNNLLSCNVIATEDSNFIFVNYLQDSATGRQDAGFITIDKNGNEITQNSFNYFNQHWLTFINRKHFIQVSNTSFLLAGADQNPNVLACKINKATLDTIKTLMYQIPGYNLALFNFIELHPNKYLLIGNKFTSAAGDPFILTIDSNLTVLDQSLINTSGNFSCKSAIINPINKQILIQGIHANSTTQNSISLMKIDTTGSVLSFSLSVSSLSTNIVQVYFSTFDSTYVCVGGKKTTKSGSWFLSKLCISKYDMNLKLLWQKIYGQNNIYNSLDKAVILPDGSIVASGKYAAQSSLPLSNADNNGVIIKVDKDGHFRWMREYSHYGPGNYVEGFYGLDQALDKGFILCGSVQNLPKAKAWAVKTDSMGCVTPGCASSTVTVDSLIIPKDTTVTTSVPEFDVSGFTFHVYPNPARDEFVVETVSDEPKTLSICDLQGREMKRLTIKHKETISASDLSSGVYLLQLYKEGRLLSYKKVIVIK